ncbi:MAG: hypothetical protein A2X94_01810 [Bdellovibrionales bacterium GWB1_55_8]|nr:MAG: hypothetical protein A2X94_01810 [Bdellovibrionales bacterium GWB1_55_8]
MSLRLLGVVGALVMGFIVITPGAANAFENGSEEFFVNANVAEELAYRMHREGIRKPINVSNRKDLKRVLKQANRYAEELNLGCEANRFFEIRFVQRSREWIAGYSALISCEDAPAPLSMYFDVDQKFLAVFEFGQ